MMAVLKEIVRKGLPPQTHAYDAPDLSPLQFLSEVMHAKHLPLDTRIKAASALLPYTNSFPRPINHRIGCKIIIGGIPAEDLGPCDNEFVAEDPEQINGISQSFSVG